MSENVFPPETLYYFVRQLFWILLWYAKQFSCDWALETQSHLEGFKTKENVGY